MRTAQDIYDKYDIMPGLQLHQLRVAAVGKVIAEAIPGVDVGSVVLTGLFHDMGNIIKSDLSRFPELLAPRGREYWEEVKAQFIQRYGDKSHEANVAIAAEMGLPPAVVQHIDHVGFSHMTRIADEEAFEPKINEYADTRVGPHGVLSLEERLGESRARYLQKGKPYYSAEGFEILSREATRIESQLFDRLPFAPSHINDTLIEPLVLELRSYPIDSKSPSI